MLQDKKFKQLERRTYLLYHQDGLIDIVVGLCILGFGINMLSDSSAFSMLAWMPLIFLPSLKKSVTIPRLGYAKFDARRTGSLRIMGVVMLFLGVVALAGLFLFLGKIPPETAAWIKEYHMLVLALFGAAVFAGVGLMSRIKRLFAYAALTLLLVAAGYLFNILPAAYVMILGSLIFFTGMVLLARFLRDYPIESREGADAGE